MRSQQLDQAQLSQLHEAEYAALGRQVLQDNLGWQPTEQIVVITDQVMLEREARVWLTAAQQLRAPLQVFVLHEMTHSGQEPPDEVVQACGAAAVSIFQTTFSLTHTQAGKQAILNHGRAASLPGASLELLLRTLAVSPLPMKQLGDKIRDTLQQAEQIHITTSNGTDLTANIRSNQIYNDCAIMLPGQLGNLPGGEVFFAPLLGSASGTVVIDGSIADDMLDQPIKIVIEAGRAVSFSGGSSARHLEQKLSHYGQSGRVVAEIGIGTNRQAHICDNLLEAEKAYGTVHVAFGNSSAIGGENNVPIHLDGLIAHPVVRVDGQLILSDNTFNL